jgi:hypothetical protein
MNKRLQKRISIELKSKIIHNTSIYEGVIKNISETGIFKIAFPRESLIDFLPSEKLKIIFQIPSGQELTLACEVIWVGINSDSPFKILCNIGLKIINPSKEYIDFVSSFNQ